MKRRVKRGNALQRKKRCNGWMNWLVGSFNATPK